MTWKHGKPWLGSTAVIIGGGPSLTQDQVDACQGLRAIAVNNSYLIAPWSDILYFADLSWWAQHRNRREYISFQGERVTLENRRVEEARSLKATGESGLDFTEGCVRTGNNGGYQALNLAINLGAEPILLIGFDMRVVERRTHWHAGHVRKYSASQYAASFKRMLGFFDDAAVTCKQRSIQVINCTPGSALQSFRQMSLPDALTYATTT